MKLSLDVAFAVFAALLVWPHHGASAVLAAVTVAVGRSRIRLCRHVAADVVAGALAGTAAGVAFHVSLAWRAS